MHFYQYLVETAICNLKLFAFTLSIYYLILSIRNIFLNLVLYLKKGPPYWQGMSLVLSLMYHLSTLFPFYRLSYMETHLKTLDFFYFVSLSVEN